MEMVQADGSGSGLALQKNDLELRLLQSFGTFCCEKLLAGYCSIKNWSFVVNFVAQKTEKLVSLCGVTRLVSLCFDQYQRLGLPLVEAVDEAMGRRIVEAFVQLLVLAQQQTHQQEQEEAALTLEHGDPTAHLKLTFQERIQALLQGEVPRLEKLLRDIQQQQQQDAIVASSAVSVVSDAPVMESEMAGEEALEDELAGLAMTEGPSLNMLQDAMLAPPSSSSPALVRDLKDFVPVEELERVKAEEEAKLQDKSQQIKSLQEELQQMEKQKQQLEQQLIDVHNYQSSQRGKRFAQMETELAKTKLEATQKAHELKKLELVVEALRSKKKKSRSRNGTNTSGTTGGGANGNIYAYGRSGTRTPSTTTMSDGVHSPTHASALSAA